MANRAKQLNCNTLTRKLQTLTLEIYTMLGNANTTTELLIVRTTKVMTQCNLKIHSTNGKIQPKMLTIP